MSCLEIRLPRVPALRPELWAEGGRSVLEELIAWCRRGPVLARVDTVDVDWPAPEGLASFDIR